MLGMLAPEPVPMLGDGLLGRLESPGGDGGRGGIGASEVEAVAESLLLLVVDFVVDFEVLGGRGYGVAVVGCEIGGVGGTSMLALNGLGVAEDERDEPMSVVWCTASRRPMPEEPE